MLRTTLAAGAITFLTAVVLIGLEMALIGALFPKDSVATYTNTEWLAAFILLSLPVATVAAILKLWRTAVDNQPAGTPISTYRADSRATRIGALLIAAAGGLAYILSLLPTYDEGEPLIDFWVTGLILALPMGAVFGLIAWVTAGPTPQIRLAQLALRLNRRGRVQFISVLEDALARQVLRQAGTMYQFRHAALQDYFPRQAR